MNTFIVMYEGGDSNPHETYFNAHWFLRPTWLPVTTPSHLSYSFPYNAPFERGN